MASDEITWLGAPEAARYLGINLRTLYRLIDAGDVPAFKIGRVLRLRQTDVDDFIERARVTPGSLAHLYPDGKDTAATEPSDT
jgi:excisionase family DNA binding protein